MKTLAYKFAFAANKKKIESIKETIQKAIQKLFIENVCQKIFRLLYLNVIQFSLWFMI